MSEKGEVKKLNIFDALRAVADGKKISRVFWEDKADYCYRKEGFLRLHKRGEAHEVFHTWLINDGDLYAEDWFVVPE